MRRTLPLIALFIGLTLHAQQDEWTSVSDINPFIGTGGHGHTHPSAQAPFGMIQLGPNSRYEGWDGCGGYHYSDTALYGFTSTHLSGTGVSDYGDLLMLPYSKPTQEGAHIQFDKTSEVAEAGYYSVTLDDGTQIEATAGDRVGILRIKFPEGGNPGIMVDLNFRDRVLEKSLEASGIGKWQGRRISEGWAREQHFYFGFDITARPDTAIEISDGVFWIPMPEGTRETTVRIGMSGTSEKGAWTNIGAELTNHDFESLRKETVAKWEVELSKSKVKSTNKDQRSIYATALYHAYSVPNVWSDVDGSYRGADNKIYLDTINRHYTVYSLWDTYRTAHPLYTITQPERTQEFVYGMLDMYKQRGRLPIWELAGNETDCMIGYHSVSVLADAIAKGYHTDTALTIEAMRATAEMDVFGLADYKEYGFLSIENESESVSKTLEYSYDDACIAWTAKLFNDYSTYNEYQQRSTGYRSLIDPESGLVRPRSNGDFFSPYEPREVNNHFTEANAYQYSFSPVHDLEGWMELLHVFSGNSQKWDKLPRRGKASVTKNRHQTLEELLDQLFTASSKTLGREQVDITGLLGQYAHGNEPSHHIAYLYNATDTPNKTSFRVHQILDQFYQNKPDGLHGNEDCGQMSAWYIMASVGLYPLVPGKPEYQLSTPVWDEIHWSMPGGEVLNISTTGTGNYIADYNRGEEGSAPIWKQKRYVTHEQLLVGGNWTVTKNDSATSWNQTERYTNSMNNPTPPAPIIRVPRSFTSPADVEIISTGYGDVWRSIQDEGVQWKKDRKGRQTKGKAIESGFIKAKTPHYGYGNHVAKAVFSQRDDNLNATWLSGVSHPQYSADGPQTLVDGILGDGDWRKGSWMGIYDQDATLEISLTNPKNLNTVNVGLLKDIRAWIALPQRVRVEILVDELWTEVGSTSLKERALTQEEPYRIALPFDFKTTLVKAIRVHYENAGALESWHPGAGYPTYFFMDEVVLD